MGGACIAGGTIFFILYCLVGKKYEQRMIEEKARLEGAARSEGNESNQGRPFTRTFSDDEHEFALRNTAGMTFL